ncbi:MAG TPA: Tm-1-like ATP-binding domain-containing protein [Terriglobia bacterium]|nr:Tm-1-like ATP-binding domain-containing protein [Terriglobia bacterium]
MPKTVAILGTLDTKGQEFGYLRSCIEAAGLDTLLVDCGILEPPQVAPDVSRQEVASAAGSRIGDLVAAHDRGAAITAMTSGAVVVTQRLFREGKIHGLISLGGSAGTTIGTAAMRSLPAGFPKVMVSTLASGDTRPFVGTKDLVMMYPIVDIAGLNRLSRRVLGNAAAAIAGMVQQEVTEPAGAKPLIAATMFGVTTPCVTAARRLLEDSGCEVLVFHATGTGGMAMEELIADGYIAGVLDVTTTELADELAGGVMSAGPQRLEAAGKRGIPQVVCPGAIDMVNFGPLNSVPEKYRGRRLHVHNANVTLMRTTPEECAELGRITAQKLSEAMGEVVVLMPLRGVSAIDAEGMPFWWPEADRAYLDALKSSLNSRIRLMEVDAHINEESFSRAAAAALLQIMKIREGSELFAAASK